MIDLCMTLIQLPLLLCSEVVHRVVVKQRLEMVEIRFEELTVHDPAVLARHEGDAAYIRPQGLHNNWSAESCKTIEGCLQPSGMKQFLLHAFGMSEELTGRSQSFEVVDAGLTSGRRR